MFGYRAPGWLPAIAFAHTENRWPLGYGVNGLAPDAIWLTGVSEYASLHKLNCGDGFRQCVYL